MKKQKLTIYLIKESYTELDKIIPKHASLKSLEVQDKDGKLGTLFISEGELISPTWVGFFGGAIEDAGIKPKNRSAKALLVTTDNNRTFCVTFGHAMHLIEPLAIERNFGLKVTLNLSDEDTIRSVDKTSLEAVALNTREQASRELGIGGFNYDIEIDILKAITAKTEDEQSTLSGRDPISITLARSVEEVRGIVARFHEAYRSDVYKEKYPWVDHIKEVRDKDRISQLNERLVEKIKEKDIANIWMAIPEIVEWEEVKGFSYKKSQKPVIRPDIHLENWLKDMETAFDIVELSLDKLKSRKVTAYNQDNEVWREWPVFFCLNAELDDGDEKYILNNTSWYAIETDFVAEIDGFYNALEDSGLVFPAYGFMNEEAYNKHVADSIDDFALMDRKLISIGAGTSKVEFCDLYSKNGHIVHVKKYGGSSVLSHLFNQGLVSAECFIRDSVFRVKVNGHLPDDFKFEAPEETPDAKAYEVCYAIMSDKPGALELPFFSKVALKHASVRVRMLGFRVTKLKIEQV
jgi:uncharacterized protein (TIGR04141 family)